MPGGGCESRAPRPWRRDGTERHGRHWSVIDHGVGEVRQTMPGEIEVELRPTLKITRFPIAVYIMSRTAEMGLGRLILATSRVYRARGCRGEVLNLDVKAFAVPRARWAAAFEQFGIPKGHTGPAEEMFEAVNTGWMDLGVAGTTCPHATSSRRPRRLWRREPRRSLRHLHQSCAHCPRAHAESWTGDEEPATKRFEQRDQALRAQASGGNSGASNPSKGSRQASISSS